MSNFGDLINIEEFGDKREEFKQDRGKVTFYCKDCEKIVEIDRPDSKGYVFICKICNGKNIAIGTEEGIKDRYRIK